MSIQTIAQPLGLSGQLAQGIGQGLAEQLPQEAERYRLSQGLKDLASKDFKGKNQFDILSSIYAIPGMTPELANLAQQQIAKQAFLNKGQQGGSAIPGAKGAGESQAIPTQAKAQSSATIQQKTSEFATPEEISNYKSSLLQEPTYEDKHALASEYIQQGITQDPNHAMQLATQELDQNRAAQQQRNAALRDSLSERLKLDLQGGGFGDFKDVAGEIQRNLIDQGEYMVNEQGITPEQASEKLGNIALDLGKSANNLKETGSFWNMFRSSKTKTQELKAQREIYQKYGFEEQFDDMVVGEMGITPLEAAHQLDPLKNQEIKNKIDNLKNKEVIPFEGAAEKLQEKKLDSIVLSIKPEDNLFSIEYELRNKGYDVNQFKQRVQELEKEKKIKLTPKQKRQQRRAVSTSYLGDILYETF